MRGLARKLALCALVLLVAGASGSDPKPAAPGLDALFPGGRISESLEALLAQHPLEKGKDFQVTEIGRDAGSSHHLVWIVSGEQPHRHDTHDLFVVMLRGYGTMRIGAETRPLGAGSLVYVPRATPHAFTNLSGAPAAAYAIYFPPFDGKDREPVE
jgi:mannose-6-phosphate isomerase-like protein (cupin superfamily)